MAEERKGKGSPCPGHTPSPGRLLQTARLTDESWSPMELGLGQTAKEQRNSSPGEMLDTPGTEAARHGPAGARVIALFSPSAPPQRAATWPLRRGTCPSRATSGGSRGQGFREDREKGHEEMP